MEALAKLERVQTRLLQRISKLEHHYLPQNHSPPSPSPLLSTDSPLVEDADTVSRLSSILRANAVNDFSFKRVPPDYYDWPLEARRDALAAHSIHHLCKTIVLVNTQAPSNVVDCSDRKNSKYYVVVVQYTARFNAEAVKTFLYSLNNGTIAKKKFNSFSQISSLSFVSATKAPIFHQGHKKWDMDPNDTCLEESSTKLKRNKMGTR